MSTNEQKKKKKKATLYVLVLSDFISVVNSIRQSPGKTYYIITVTLCHEQMYDRKNTQSLATEFKAN